MKTLREIYSSHKGKVSDKWDYYLDQYSEKLLPIKDQSINLLEIGIQNGGSLEIWSKFFPNHNSIVGCDINPKCEKLVYDSTKIKVIVGDANHEQTKEKIIDLSAEYDLVIDDGSHRSSDIVKSFVNYFPLLKDDGIYIIEDLHCSYWSTFEGGLFFPGSAVTFFKKIIDICNFQHWGLTKEKESLFKLFEHNYKVDFSKIGLDHIYSIEFGNSMCFIRKKLPHKNLLGKEWIVGKNPEVEPLVNPDKKNDEKIKVPDQSLNPWSNNNMTPDEEVLMLRSQLNRPFDPIGKVTVIINNRNLLTWPKAMIKKIQNFDSLAEIIIIDNDSSYLPTLDWYKTLPHKVIKLPNIGHKAPWIHEVNNQIRTEFYVVTDPDLDLSNVPNDCLTHLAMCLCRFKEYGKIGLSLDISAIPLDSAYYNHVNTFEKSYWDSPLISNLIRQAPIDTTFAIYNKKLLNTYKKCGARTDKPYTARHLPWDLTEHDEEFSYYLKHANSSSSYVRFIKNINKDS